MSKNRLSAFAKLPSPRQRGIYTNEQTNKELKRRIWRDRQKEDGRKERMEEPKKNVIISVTREKKSKTREEEREKNKKETDKERGKGEGEMKSERRDTMVAS